MKGKESGARNKRKDQTNERLLKKAQPRVKPDEKHQAPAHRKTELKCQLLIQKSVIMSGLL